MIERNAGTGLNEASDVVAGEEDGLLVRGAEHRAVLLDVADGAEILGLADTGVTRLGIAELARQGKLALVIHRLVGEADERIPVDRRLDLPACIRGERLAEVDAAQAGAELGMQRFVSELGHGGWTSGMRVTARRCASERSI
jgi:hypothetical protein